MTESADQGLVSPSDIADIAGVSRGAVSNWRKRADDFPQALAGSAAKPLFSREQVTSWLAGRGHDIKSDAGETAVWAAMNALRGELSVEESIDLILSLTCARKSDDSSTTIVPSDLRVSPAALAGLTTAVDSVDKSELGRAADFLLERLVRSQGKVGADYGFVGSRTSTLLAKLAASRPGDVLYDPACGIAVALIAAIDEGARPSRVVGHDVNDRALRIAHQRALLHGAIIEFLATDVLREDADSALQADLIIAEPPFGLRLDASVRLTDARFEFGTPPRKSADTAWLQHVVAHLTDTGRGYVLTPAGTLFHGGEERVIRTELIRRGCVEAIVGLPGKMLPHTAIPLALWVVRPPTSADAHDEILFIDATEVESPEESVADWLQDAEKRLDVPHADVFVTDVLAAESVLTPQRWVDRTEREPADVARVYAEGWTAINDTMRRLQNVLSSFEHFADFSKPRVLTVAELIDEGVLELRMGRPADRNENLPEELRDRIATADDVRDGTLREIGLEDDFDNLPDLTCEGDVLVTTMNTIRARVDEAGGHLPSTGVYRLRVIDHDVVSPGYLAIALTGGWNGRFQPGNTIQRASIRELEVPLVPKGDQMNISLAMISVRLLREQAVHLADEATVVGNALLDSVRYNAALIAPAPESVGETGQDGTTNSEGAK